MDSSDESILDKAIIRIGNIDNFAESSEDIIEEAIFAISSLNCFLETGLKLDKQTRECFISDSDKLSSNLLRITLENFSLLDNDLRFWTIMRSKTGGVQDLSWSPVLGRGLEVVINDAKCWMTSLKSSLM